MRLRYLQQALPSPPPPLWNVDPSGGVHGAVLHHSQRVALRKAGITHSDGGDGAMLPDHTNPRTITRHQQNPHHIMHRRPLDPQHARSAPAGPGPGPACHTITQQHNNSIITYNN